MLSQDENLEGLSRINRELVALEAMDSPQRVVLDMDSTEIRVYGEQEFSGYNGHFESTCYHPLLLFNEEGDCLGAKLRPGNVQSAEDWDEVLLPEIERQQELGKEGVCFGRMPRLPMDIPVDILTRGADSFSANMWGRAQGPRAPTAQGELK